MYIFYGGSTFFKTLIVRTPAPFLEGTEYYKNTDINNKSKANVQI